MSENPAISTNKAIRRLQFRKAVKAVLDEARRPWGRHDHIGRLAAAMEHAYAAGAANVGLPEEDVTTMGHVRWDAIPVRAKEVLRDLWPIVEDNLAAIEAGSVLAVMEGAGRTGKPGDKVELTLWRRSGSTLEHIPSRSRYEWPATWASALVRLNILEPLPLRDQPAHYTKLTQMGVATIKAALAEGSYLR